MAQGKLNELSILDAVEKVILESGDSILIYDLIEKAAEIKGIDKEDDDAMTQIYMDITLSGRFVFVGEDKWALKKGHLEAWDADSYVYSKDEKVEIEEGLEDDEDIDFEEFVLKDADELEDVEDIEELEDLDEEIIEEKEYVDVGLDLETTDEDDYADDIDLDIDDAKYDEDDYNEIMDDYEDMYDE